MYLDDAVLEFPQSGERFEGVPNFREWRARYPADVEFEIRRVRGGGDVWTMEVAVRYDRGPWNFGVSIHEFRGDKIAKETIYYAEPFEAPEWRARWRAAPPPPAPEPDHPHRRDGGAGVDRPWWDPAFSRCGDRAGSRPSGHDSGSLRPHRRPRRAAPSCSRPR